MIGPSFRRHKMVLIYKDNALSASLTKMRETDKIELQNMLISTDLGTKGGETVASIAQRW